MDSRRASAIICRPVDALAEAREADRKLAPIIARRRQSKNKNNNNNGNKSNQQNGEDDDDDTDGMWLLGVPVTCKECFALEGCQHSAGHPMRKGKMAVATAPVVQRAIDAGAIILVLTNTSELCM